MPTLTSWGAVEGQVRPSLASSPPRDAFPRGRHMSLVPGLSCCSQEHLGSLWLTDPQMEKFQLPCGKETCCPAPAKAAGQSTAGPPFFPGYPRRGGWLCGRAPWAAQPGDFDPGFRFRGGRGLIYQVPELRRGTLITAWPRCARRGPMAENAAFPLGSGQGLMKKGPETLAVSRKTSFPDHFSPFPSKVH